MIEIDHVSQVFRTSGRQDHLALSDISLTIEDGAFVSILGPSGCGKSTLLYIVGGFVNPTGGVAKVKGKPITGPGPDRGPVFQEFALFPWKSVLGNVMYGPRQQGVKHDEAEAQSRRLIEMVGLKGFEHFYPKELSGGMKQRVALARTLAYHPAVLLMDEPFGALDAHTRTRLQNDLLNIWERDRKTVLFVTHSVEEAVFLSDKVVVMTRSPGRIKEIVDIGLPRPAPPGRAVAGSALSEIRRRYRAHDRRHQRRRAAPMMTARALVSRSAPLLACLGLLGVWQVAALILNNDSFPTALEAIRAIPSILGDKESLINILASLRRMAIGFGLAVAVSIPLGLMMGRSRAVASFFNPLLMVIYPVPKAALMPIIMLWLGVGDVAKTLVIFLGVSLPVIYHSFQGAKAVEEKMLWSGAAMGLSAAQRMIRIVLPAALPEILTGCRTGLVLALITMVTSEMIARQSGAGNILFNALDMGQYDTVFAMIIIIGAMGIGLDAAFEKMRARLVKWSEPRFDLPLSFS